MKSILKDLPALFCSLVPEGSFPGDPIDQLLEELALFTYLGFTSTCLSLPQGFHFPPLPHPSPYKLLFSICIFVFRGIAHSCGRTGMWVPPIPACHHTPGAPCTCLCWLPPQPILLPSPSATSILLSHLLAGLLALGSDEAKPHKRCLFCSIP